MISFTFLKRFKTLGLADFCNLYFIVYHHDSSNLVLVFGDKFSFGFEIHHSYSRHPWWLNRVSLAKLIKFGTFLRRFLHTHLNVSVQFDIRIRTTQTSADRKNKNDLFSIQFVYGFSYQFSFGISFRIASIQWWHNLTIAH